MQLQEAYHTSIKQNYVYRFKIATTFVFMTVKSTQLFILIIPTTITQTYQSIKENLCWRNCLLILIVYKSNMEYYKL